VSSELVIDCLGRPCPVPVIELARALRDLAPGALASVLSDDPAALVDVPAFCRMRGHAFVGATPAEVGTLLTVRVGGA
jgi:TusA-related sulfurtransferase